MTSDSDVHAANSVSFLGSEVLELFEFDGALAHGSAGGALAGSEDLGEFSDVSAKRGSSPGGWFLASRW